MSSVWRSTGRASLVWLLAAGIGCGTGSIEGPSPADGTPASTGDGAQEGDGPALPGHRGEEDDLVHPPREACEPIHARLWPLTPRQSASSLERLLPASELNAVRRNDGVTLVDFFGNPISRFESELTASLSQNASFAEPFSSDPGLLIASPNYVKAMFEGARDLAARTLEAEHMPDCVSTPDPACAREVIDHLGPRLFRRPVRSEERSSLLAFFEAQQDAVGAEAALELLVRRLQLSPATFFRFEMGAEGRGGPLTPHQTASLIAFSITDGPPDEALRRAADDGSILDAEVARGHVQRLTREEPTLESLINASRDDPKNARGLMRFYREWLDMDAIRREDRPYLSQLIVTNPDNGKRSRVDFGRVQRWYDNEMMQFAWWVSYRGSGTLGELLSSDQLAIFGSRTLLATHRLWDLIGTDAEDTTGLHPAPDTRRGILSHRGWLTAHDTPSTRGAAIRSAFLCQELLVPEAVDNNLSGLQDELEAQEGADLTPRTVRDRHLNDPSCSGCHEMMDPLGFPFDIFEKAGLERAHYAGVLYREGEPRSTNHPDAQVPDHWHGEPIDTSGGIVGSQSIDGPVSDHVQLVERLAQANEVKDCVASQLYHYVVGATGAEANACDLAELQQGFRSSDGSMLELFADTVSKAALTPRLEVE